MGKKTWSVTLRKECRLRKTEADGLLGRKRMHNINEVTVEWRKFNNEELRNFYSSYNSIGVKSKGRCAGLSM
jgi:hypothetical protein